MSQAYELLNSLADATPSLQLANPETEPHILISNDRVVTVPKELQRIAVQYDHDVETVTFDCPRYWDGLDMSELRVYVNYMRRDRVVGCYLAQNVTVDTTDSAIMHFDWTISRNVSQVAGEIKFLVCIKKGDSEGNEVNHWNSELNNQMYVSEGLEVGNEFFDDYPDIILQWEEDVQRVKDELIEEAKPFVVTIVSLNVSGGEEIYTADKTYAEITAAVDAGKHCYAKLTNGSSSSLVVFTLSAIESDSITFTSFAKSSVGLRMRAAVLVIASNNEILVDILEAQPLVRTIGILKGSGDGTITQAVAGTNYVTPDGMNTAIQSAIQNTWEASY